MKRNYVPGEYEAVVSLPAGTITHDAFQYFVLDDFYKFTMSDIVVYADGVLLAPSNYELATDTYYTNLESTRSVKTLYSQIKVTNATYDGQALTVDGNNFGTYTDNEATVKYANTLKKTVVEISTDTVAVTDTIYLITTSSTHVTLTLPSELVEGFNVGAYKVTGVDSPEAIVDGNGILIGGDATQVIVGQSEGMSIIANGAYFIVQDNRGGLQRKLSQSTGILSGFGVSTNVDGVSIDVAPGIYAIEDATDMLSPVSDTFQYDGVVGYQINNLSTEGITFVYIDASGALSQQTNVTTAPEQWRTMARFATVQHFFGTGAIETSLEYATPPNNPASRVSTFMNTIGIIREGIVISGASANNLQLANTSGVLVSPGSNQVVSSINPDNVPVPAGDPIAALVYLTQNDVVRLDTGAAAIIDVLYYDVAGTPTLIPGNSTTSCIHRVYMGIDGTTAVQPGQNTYATLGIAKDALFSGEDTFIENPILNKITTLLCYVIATKSATNLNSASDALLFVTDKFGSGGSISTGGPGSSTTQEGYDNSISDPELLTNNTRLSLDIRNGSSLDTNSVFTVQNIAGAKILDVTGEVVKAPFGATFGIGGGLDFAEITGGSIKTTSGDAVVELTPIGGLSKVNLSDSLSTGTMSYTDGGGFNISKVTTFENGAKSGETGAQNAAAIALDGSTLVSGDGLVALETAFTNVDNEFSAQQSVKTNDDSVVLKPQGGGFPQVLLSNVGSSWSLQLNPDGSIDFRDLSTNNAIFKLEEGASAFRIAVKSNNDVQLVASSGNLYVGDGTPTEKLHVFGNIKASGTISAGAFANDTTANRPATPVTAQPFFDTTLGIPIWHDGTNWIDATGTTV